MPPKRAGGRPWFAAARPAPRRSGNPPSRTSLETFVSLPSGPAPARGQSIPQPLDPGESPMTAATTLPATLAEVLAYRHPGVLRRYAKEQHASREEAEEVFQETLKWLYLCGCRLRDNVACAMTAEIARL